MNNDLPRFLDPWHTGERKSHSIPKKMRKASQSALSEEEYEAYRRLREALMYRWARPIDDGKRVELYDDNTISIRCVDYDDVVLHVEMSFQLLKLRTWKLQFLVNNKVVAEVAGEKWHRKNKEQLK